MKPVHDPHSRSGTTQPPSRDALTAHQLARLRELLSAIRPANPFYEARLADTGLDAALDDLAAFPHRCPLTTREDLVADQSAHAPWGTNLTYPLERYTRISQTSGSSHRPLRWLDTPESWAGMLDSKARTLDAAGLAPGDRVLFPFSFGPFLGFWSAFEAAGRRGILAIPAGGMSSVGRLKMLTETAATAVFCTPTYALRLGEMAAGHEVEPGDTALRAIIVGGEPGGSVPAVRERIESLWPGARVYDHHGMSEIGTVTYPCPARRDVLHVIEEAYLPEVLEPGGPAPAAAGVDGELVLTGLGRHGSPLLRYRTGDLVKVAALGRCACGSEEMALEGGILGRCDDVVVVRGVNLHPAGVDAVLRRFPEVAEYRVRVGTVRGMREVSVEIECSGNRNAATGVADAVRRELKAAFSVRIPVTAVPAGTLPRFEMKARRWVSE